MTGPPAVGKRAANGVRWLLRPLLIAVLAVGLGLVVVIPDLWLPMVLGGLALAATVRGTRARQRQGVAVDTLSQAEQFLKALGALIVTGLAGLIACLTVCTPITLATAQLVPALGLDHPGDFFGPMAAALGAVLGLLAGGVAAGYTIRRVHRALHVPSDPADPPGAPPPQLPPIVADVEPPPCPICGLRHPVRTSCREAQAVGAIDSRTHHEPPVAPEALDPAADRAAPLATPVATLHWSILLLALTALGVGLVLLTRPALLLGGWQGQRWGRLLGGLQLLFAGLALVRTARHHQACGRAGRGPAWTGSMRTFLGVLATAWLTLVAGLVVFGGILRAVGWWSGDQPDPIRERTTLLVSFVASLVPTAAAMVSAFRFLNRRLVPEDPA